MSSAPAFGQVFTRVVVETRSQAEERHRAEEFRRQQDLRRRADERRREEMRQEEIRREESRRQLRLIMEQRQQDMTAQQLAANAAQANHDSERNAASATRAEITIERGNLPNFDGRALNYAAKAQSMLNGCPAAIDQEECYALAATEKSLADKYTALAQGSRDRIMHLENDLREHERLARAYAAERDDHLSRRAELESELRGPKYIEVRPNLNAPRVITPIEVKIRAF